MIMKNYTIAPNKDATAWFVKLEDIAVEEEYDNLDKAVEAGERIAEDNKPSTLTILNKFHEEDEKRTFDN